MAQEVVSDASLVGTASASGCRPTISQLSKRLGNLAQARAPTGGEIIVPGGYSARNAHRCFLKKTRQCSHNVEPDAARWPDEVRLSDLEPRFICTACGKRGSIIRSVDEPLQMSASGQRRFYACDASHSTRRLEFVSILHQVAM